MMSLHDILAHGWPDRGGWQVCGDEILAGDGGPVPTPEEIEAARADAEAAAAALAATIAARGIARTAMREDWAALPAWIRGPFGGTYTAAAALLDQGDDAAASALIQFAEAPTGYTLEQAATFETIRTGLLASIAALP
jgi:hypothetical protein